LHLLEGQGLIRSKRNEVSILDRAGLEAAADWCYGVPEAEYERIFGFNLSMGTNAASASLDAKSGGRQ
jgi:hypothetical protein